MREHRTELPPAAARRPVPNVIGEILSSSPTADRNPKTTAATAATAAATTAYGRRIVFFPIRAAYGKSAGSFLGFDRHFSSLT